MLDFYGSLLNIRKWDTKDVDEILDRFISFELLELASYTDSYNEGLCKYFTHNLYAKLKNSGFNVTKIDLSKLYEEIQSHEFLLMSYQDLDNNINYVLIDPIYGKFVKHNEQETLLYFDEWPSEILRDINPNLLKNILKDRYSYVEDKDIQDYLTGFTGKRDDIDLEYLILRKYEDKGKQIA